MIFERLEEQSQPLTPISTRPKHQLRKDGELSGFPTLGNEGQKDTAKNTEEPEKEPRLPHPSPAPLQREASTQKASRYTQTSGLYSLLLLLQEPP